MYVEVMESNISHLHSSKVLGGPKCMIRLYNIQVRKVGTKMIIMLIDSFDSMNH